MKLKKEKLIGGLLIILILIIIIIFGAENIYVDVTNNNNYQAPLNTSEGMISTGYGIVADDSRAVEVGMAILEDGGSAVDAAIAVSYALGVVSPFASGLGGSGIMLVYPGDGTDPVVYDYIGTASQNISGPTAVPGFVKGMAMAHYDYGKLDMERILDPSIKLAREGVNVSVLLNSMINTSGFRIDSNLRSIFFQNGKGLAVDSMLKQPKLADAIERIKENGAVEFYRGEIAEEIVKNSNLTLNDLASFEVVKTEPVKGSFSGYDVYSSPPPAGGITLIQTLLLAERLKLENHNQDSAGFISLLSKITQVVYHDRLRTIYDPAFNAVDIERLTSDAYIAELASQVESVEDISGLVVDDSPGDSNDDENTTHIVVLDKNGMMVSVTNTLSQFFGTGKSAYGFFLNNHMDNFSISDSSLNLVAPGKRPRSYIAPSILVKDGSALMGIGSPGGKRIPLMINQMLVRNLKNGESIESAINAPRFFYYKNMIFLESDYLPEPEKNILQKEGYYIIVYPNHQFYGSVNVLYMDYANMKISGGGDKRRNGYVRWEIE